MNQTNFLKLGIILVILFLSAGLSLRVSPGLVQWIGLIVLGIVALPLLINRLEYGILALIPIAFLVNFQIGTGTAVALNAAFLLVIILIGGWFLRMILIDKQVRLTPSRGNLPAMLFILACLVSFVAGHIDWVPFATEKASLSAQIGGLLLYILPVGFLLLVGNMVREIVWLQRFVWLFLALGYIFVLSRVTEIPFNPIFSLFTSAINTGAMVWLWLAALAGGQVLFNPSLGLKWRVILMGLIVAQFASAVLYGRDEWVSGWLPALIAIFILIWLRSWRWGLLALALGAGAFLTYQAILVGGIMTPSQQYSISSRGATLPILLELIKANPLLGLGPANYRFYTPLYPILGWTVQFNSHNNYIDLVAQTGLIGLALFAWLMGALAYTGWKLRREVSDGFSQGYVNAALAGLVAMLVSGFLGDWFLPFLYNVGIPGFRASIFAWLFLGGLVALENIVRDQRNSMVGA